MKTEFTVRELILLQMELETKDIRIKILESRLASAEEFILKKGLIKKYFNEFIGDKK
jgi:hypothetical protein